MPNKIEEIIFALTNKYHEKSHYNKMTRRIFLPPMENALQSGKTC